MIRILKSKKVTDKISKISKEMQNSLSAQIVISAKLVESTAKLSIQKGFRSGDTYIRNGIERRRSIPGEAPKTDRGRLVASIFSKFPSIGKGLIAEVGTNIKYGKLLEFGTVKMAARPWLFPAFKKNANAIIKRIENVLSGAVRDNKKK